MEDKLRPQCLDASAFCACLQSRRTARAVTALYDEAMRPLGLKTTQFTLLVALALAGEAPLTRVAGKLAMDRTTLTRNFRPLEKRRWIVSAPGKDQRVRVHRLTPKGRDLLARALPVWREVQARLVGRIGPDRWTELNRGMAELAEAASA